MWYYSVGGQQVGPVDDRALEDLARQGVIHPETLVWREGMANWQPYGARHSAPTPPVAYAPQAYAPAVPVGPYFDFALWPTRALGMLIDGLFVVVAMIALYFAAYIFGTTVGLSTLSAQGAANGGATACCCMLLLSPVATLLVGLYNKVYLLGTRGFSVGQGLLKLKVVDARGQKLEMGKAFVRLIAQAGMSLIPFLSLVDYLWPLWDPRRQTLHDKAVDCYVINNPTGL